MAWLLCNGPYLVIFGETSHYGNLQPASEMSNYSSFTKISWVVTAIGIWLHQVRSNVVSRISNLVQKLFCTGTVAQKTTTSIGLPNINIPSITDFGIGKRQIQKLVKRKIPICITCSLPRHKNKKKRIQIMTIVSKTVPMILKKNMYQGAWNILQWVDNHTPADGLLISPVPTPQCHSSSSLIHRPREEKK